MAVSRRPPPALPDLSRMTYNASRTGLMDFLRWVRHSFSGIPGGAGVEVGTSLNPVIVADEADADIGTVSAGWMPADAQLVVESATPSGLANANTQGSAETVSRSDHQHKRDVRVALNGSDVGTRNRINFVDSTGELTVTDDAGNDEVDIDLSTVGSVPAFPLLAPDGTAAAPSYSFASDPSAGLYIDAGPNTTLKGADGSGTDSGGDRASLRTGRSTGNAASAPLSLQVCPAGSASGSSLNAYQTGLFITGNGQVTVGGVNSNATPVTNSYLGMNAATGTTDVAGGHTDVAGGQGTGAGIGGSVRFRTAPAAASGSSQNALVVRWEIDTSGHLRPTAASDDTYDIGSSSLRTRLNYLGQIVLGVRSPAQITGDQNDYAPGTKGFWRLSSDASRNITGILAAADGAELTIVNVGANDIVLQHQNAGSSAANRLICPGAADLTISADEGAKAIYDGTTSRWRVFQL